MQNSKKVGEYIRVILLVWVTLVGARHFFGDIFTHRLTREAILAEMEQRDVITFVEEDGIMLFLAHTIPYSIHYDSSVKPLYIVYIYIRQARCFYRDIYFGKSSGCGTYTMKIRCL